MYLQLLRMREQHLSMHRGSELLVQDIHQQMRLSEVLDWDESVRTGRFRYVLLWLQLLALRTSFEVSAGCNLPQNSHAVPDDTVQDLQLP